MTTATATKSRKPARKPARRVEMSRIVNGGFAIAMTIGAGATAKNCSYFVHPIPAGFGLGFHFEKFIHQQAEGEPAEYDVLLRGRESSCTCKGNSYRGHCKHVEALLALIAAGKLPVPESTPRPAKSQPWCDLCNDNPEVYCERCAL